MRAQMRKDLFLNINLQIILFSFNFDIIKSSGQKKRLPSEGEPLATNGGGNAMKARYKE